MCIGFLELLKWICKYVIVLSLKKSNGVFVVGLMYFCG